MNLINVDFHIEVLRYQNYYAKSGSNFFPVDFLIWHMSMFCLWEIITRSSEIMQTVSVIQYYDICLKLV